MERTLAFILLATSLVVPASAREITEGSKLNETLHRSGSDDDITGRADFKSRNGRSSFRIRIQHGPANHELELRVGGVNRGAITTSRGGSANVLFTTPRTGKSQLLDFDPRGREIEIHDLNDDKLLTNTGGSRIADERVNLLSTGIQPGANGHATLKVKKGRSQFEVEIEDVTDGAYDLFVDGVLRGTITVAGGEGEIEFGDDAPLNFDPLGKLIEVSQSGTVVLTATFLAGAPGVNVCTPSERRTELINSGAVPAASGHADFAIGEDCERNFDVEVEDLPDGDYDLTVAGNLHGTIAVAGGRGKIEFSSDSDDPGELPLDFEPRGALVEVKQGVTLFFSVTMPE